MFIIVEGPDGAGKSTFVDQLQRQLWREERGCVLINPKAAPHLGQPREYADCLSFYQPGGDIDLILDRCWRSEAVYGPRYRKVLPDWETLDYLDRWAQARGAVYVQLDAPDEVLIQRVANRGDDLIKVEDLPRLAHDYRRLATHYPWNGATWPVADAEQVIAMARVADQAVMSKES
jgi:thymidylate kinase